MVVRNFGGCRCEPSPTPLVDYLSGEATRAAFIRKSCQEFTNAVYSCSFYVRSLWWVFGVAENCGGVAAFTIAAMPARSAAASVGHAAITKLRSASVPWADDVGVALRGAFFVESLAE